MLQLSLCTPRRHTGRGEVQLNHRCEVSLTSWPLYSEAQLHRRLDRIHSWPEGSGEETTICLPTRHWNPKCSSQSLLTVPTMLPHFRSVLYISIKHILIRLTWCSVVPHWMGTMHSTSLLTQSHAFLLSSYCFTNFVPAINCTTPDLPQHMDDKS